MNNQDKVKTTRVELRLAPNQKLELKQKAADFDMSMSEYIILKCGLSAPGPITITGLDEA